VDLDDPDLPEWMPNALVMALFGYDEQQVMNMSIAVKVRLLLVHGEITKRASGVNDMKPPGMPHQPGPIAR
jgi:hypothetical protein